MTTENATNGVVRSLALIWRLEDGRVVEANPALAEAAGLPRERIAGMRLPELPLWTEPELPERVLAELRRGRSVHEPEVTWRNGTGRLRGRLHADPLELGGSPHGLLILQESDETYRSLFEQAVTPMYRSTPDGRLLDANPALARMLGYASVGEMMREIGNLRDLYITPEAREEFLAQLDSRNILDGEEFALRRRDGSIVWVSEHARTLRDAEGRLEYFEGLLQDITQRKRAEAELAHSELRYRTLVENSQDGVFVREGSHYVYVNRAFAAMLGYREEELIGRHYRDIYAPENLSAADARHSRHMQGDSTPGEYEARLLHKDGQTRVIVSCTTSTFTQDGVTLVTGTVRDITRQKRIERELRHNATHDPLTGLPNRTLFSERLQRAMQYGRQDGGAGYAVLFIDLDTFKLVNDSLGHAQGDRLLCDIAERLKQCIRPWDTLARHGGDEFTVLLEQVRDIHDALRIAEDIHAVLRKPIQLGEHQVFADASIGIAPGKPEYRTTEEVLRDADAAMYRAKSLGKSNTAVFDDSMLDMAKQRLEMETRLRYALAHNEFRAWYQPIVDLRTARLTGFEALLRWEHPEQGLMAPDRFLRVAEDSGLLLSIGWWMLMETSRQLSMWQRAVPAARNLSVSVNIGHQQFVHTDLPMHVAEALQQSGLTPNRLHVEITESVFMEDPVRALEMLHRLKRLGVGLHMDDFGTGYSSLSYLSRLPLDALKIDRSFIVDLAQGRRAQAIVRAIVQLARELDLTVVAEGIETDAQARQLRKLGCTRGQGWHFARPMPPQDVDRLLAEGAYDRKLRL